MDPSSSNEMAAPAAPGLPESRPAAVCLARLGYLAPALAIYLGATFFTDAFFMGDTVHYADMIEDSTALVLSDFGHLLWLLLGRLLSDFSRLFDGRADTISVLSAVCWAAGLGAALLMYDLAFRAARRMWAAGLVAAAFVFSQGFLNFAQTGCAYVPGLFLLLLGLRLSFGAEDKSAHSGADGIGAGLAFAGAVAVWFPYVLAIPGTLAATLILSGWSPWRFRAAARAAVVFAAALALFYGAAAAAQGIHGPAGFLQWMSASSHGITTGGFSRMVFGFARSFINLGGDGVVFKRFLLRDPYNPVSFLELLRLNLGKFLLFYVFLGVVLSALAFSPKGRRYLVFLAACALPVLAFAARWQGGDMERYFPFYPAFFLALAAVLAEGPWVILCRSAAVVWLVAAVTMNAGAMAKTTLNNQQERVVARIGPIERAWKPHSRIATVLIQDEVFAFHWNFPFHPVNRTGVLARRPGVIPPVLDIVDRGGEQTPLWRRTFAREAFSVWSAGGDLWVSRQAFAPRPRADSAWVEGDDPQVGWRDVYGFFSRLETGKSVGGEDGFFLLPPSPKNREILARWIRS